MTVLDKVKQLENYIRASNGQADELIDLTLDKLIAREKAKLEEWLAHLKPQLQEFETQYGLESADFYQRYERGEMGDDLDFVEWASVYDMFLHSQEQLKTLHS